MRTSSDAIAYWMSLLRPVTRLTFTPGPELELVAGDGRADGRADEASLDAVVRERGLEDAAALVDEAAVGFLAAPPLQHVGGGQLPRSPTRPGASSPSVDHELTARVLDRGRDLDGRRATGSVRRGLRFGLRLGDDVGDGIGLGQVLVAA